MEPLIEDVRQRIPSVYERRRSGGGLSIFQAKCAVLELTGVELSRREIRASASPEEELTLVDLTTVVDRVLRSPSSDSFSFDSVFSMLDSRQRGYITVDDLLAVTSNSSVST